MAGQAGVQSLERAFGLLEALSYQPGGMQLQELATGTGLHKSTVHRMLASLMALGYVERAGEVEGRYRLSLKLFEMAGRVVENIDVLDLARDTLERLRDDAGEAVHLVVRDGPHIVYIYKSESPSGHSQMVSRIGMRRPMYCTAAGKSMLALLGEGEVAALWAQSEITKLTPHTITDLDTLGEELAEIRRRGYALDNQENEMGVRCIAAAIRDYTGQSRAAFSLSAPLTRLDDGRILELAPRVLAAAAAISAKLGYREG